MGSIGDLKGLSLGSMPPFPTKNQGVVEWRQLYASDFLGSRV